MKEIKYIGLLMACVLVLSVAGCGKAAEAPSGDANKSASSGQETVVKTEKTEAADMSVTDMIGREVKVVPGSYRKVVCIGAGALRMYSYIGDVTLLCGVEDIDNTSLNERPKMFDSVARPYMIVYSDAFSALPSCGVGGPNAQTAEAEKILSCEPDIVISEYEDTEKSDALFAQLGVPVITLKAGQNVFDDNFFGSLRLLGTVFGREERAEALIKYINSEKEEIAARTKDIADSDKPRVYICGLGNWGTTNHLLTSENYASFNASNITNVLSGIGTPGNFPIEEEKFISLGEDMDIMIMDAAAVKNIKPLYAEDPHMFDSCKAWRNGEVYLQMAFNAYYTNYEVALANTWFIAKTVYPERFADIDITAKTDEITNEFLGKAVGSEMFAFPSSFGGYQKIDTSAFFNK